MPKKEVVEMKDTEIIRMNIKVPAYIRDYYKSQGEKYSVPYTNYISMLLTQIYENERNKELVSDLNDTLKSLKNNTGDITAEEMMLQMKDVIKFFQEKELEL